METLVEPFNTWHLNVSSACGWLKLEALRGLPIKNREEPADEVAPRFLQSAYCR